MQAAFAGLTYKTLTEQDRIRLDTSIIHATTVKQTAPQGDDTSLYHIFERLNSGGRRLTDQEMRLAIYHGALIDLIRDLNSYKPWRDVYGNQHSRLKDQELILRFFSLYYGLNGYERPLSEFLNKYAGKNRSPKIDELESLRKLFRKTVDTFKEAIPEKLFRPTSSLNVAVFDSCMVGMARRLNMPGSREPASALIRTAYKKLLEDKDYLTATSRSTADPLFVKRRIEKATAAFAKC